MATKRVSTTKDSTGGKDWATDPSPKGINKRRQRALLVGFLTVVANKHFSDPAIPLVNYVTKTGAVLKAAKIQNTKVTSHVLTAGQDFINMKYVYGHLRPLKPQEVNGLVILARSNSDPFSAMAQRFWDQGESLLNYPIGDEHCGAAIDMLALNRPLPQNGVTK